MLSHTCESRMHVDIDACVPPSACRFNVSWAQFLSHLLTKPRAVGFSAAMLAALRNAQQTKVLVPPFHTLMHSTTCQVRRVVQSSFIQCYVQELLQHNICSDNWWMFRSLELHMKKRMCLPQLLAYSYIGTQWAPAHTRRRPRPWRANRNRVGTTHRLGPPHPPHVPSRPPQHSGSCSRGGSNGQAQEHHQSASEDVEESQGYARGGQQTRETARQQAAAEKVTLTDEDMEVCCTCYKTRQHKSFPGDTTANESAFYLHAPVTHHYVSTCTAHPPLLHCRHIYDSGGCHRKVMFRIPK